MTRLIRDLQWANCVAKPLGINPKRAPTRPMLAGIRYEAALAAAIPIADHGVWWQFQDRCGEGFCQTDLVIRGLRADLVLEAKYTYTDEAWDQLEGLYLPVVGKALRRPTLGIQVCKRFLSGVGPQVAVANDLPAAIAYAQEGRRTVLHWIGKNAPPLVPLQRAA